MRLVLAWLLVFSQSGIFVSWQDTNQMFSCVFVNSHLYGCYDETSVTIPYGGIDGVFVPARYIDIQHFYADGTTTSERVHAPTVLFLPLVYGKG